MKGEEEGLLIVNDHLGKEVEEDLFKEVSNREESVPVVQIEKEVVIAEIKTASPKNKQKRKPKHARNKTGKAKSKTSNLEIKTNTNSNQKTSDHKRRSAGRPKSVVK